MRSSDRWPLPRPRPRQAVLRPCGARDRRGAVSCRMRVHVRDDEAAIGYGDVIRATGKMFQPRGFQTPAVRLCRLSRPEGHLRRGERARRQGVGDSPAREGDLSYDPGLAGAHTAGLCRRRHWSRRRHTQAMVLGEEGGLTDEIRDRFMTAGVTHILSISGSHLGLVAVVCFALIRWALFLCPNRGTIA